ncbi:type VI secretion system baseplate subunit TssG [Burkholderia sp. Bp8998]|uniref:type VI secretion system baseplate subunit TssG n=1 Tax=Burkholderia sp. Bp8998 TaxID=2184557 RepID=UPI000F5A1A05|nr:type VI secretion system baseplate subunit TssG [Burkholderia sp. Bp8998]RQS18322.1 type VI secretion system baseplate subunit TssG [Burkholderia sp. Bp8998]
MKRATLPALVRDSTLSPDLLDSLQTEPWRFGFLSLLRRIGANPAVDPVGTARRPQAEPFRLGQQPSLAFAPREISSVQEAAGRLKVRLFGLGMLGPNGPLPIHVTEWAREREEGRRDTTTVDFFDIFHHRFLTLFYRAWASAQSTAGLDRKDDERFSFYIASLTGHDTAEIGRRPLPSHARLAASAHLVRESRNADGLRATLEHYFGVPVAIEENVFHWIAIDPSDQGRMGRPGAAATMGQAAMLGRVTPDRQHRFRIVIGPIDLDAYLRFTPQGEDLPRLVEWVRAFVGYELEWELELRIKPESAPPAVMGGQQRMGWSGWLGHPRPDRPITGMRFEPERYVRHFEQHTSEFDNRP